VSRWKPGRPSPALVLAAVALFAALGGTGYAASTIVAPAHTAAKKAKPLTRSQVNKLVAAYVKAHRSSLRGVAGPAGAAGATGPAGAPGKNGTNGTNGVDGHTGPQGPGAIRVAAEGTSATAGAQPLATVGPWTLTITCAPNAPNAVVKITGPGTITYSATTGDTGAANPTSLTSSAIGSGKSIGINDGKSIGVTGYLQSGQTLDRLDFQMSASNGGLFESCPLVGSAIPVPAA